MSDSVGKDLDGVVGLAEGGQVAVVVDEDVPAGHEVRVALDGREAVKEGEVLVQEGLLLLEGAGRAEL